MKKMAATGMRMTGKSEVVSVALAGDEGIASIRGTATIVNNGAVRRIEVDAREVWVLGEGEWKLKESTVLSMREGGASVP